MKNNARRIGWLYLGIVLFQLFISFLFLFVGKYFPWNSYTSILLGQFLLLFPVFIFYLLTRSKPNNYMAYRKMDGVSVLLCVVFTFCMTPVITVVNLFVSLFATSGNESVNSVVSGIPLLAGLLFVGVLPAFSEEFIFRGTVYGGLRKNGMVPAALVSGLIFGAMHMNLNQFAYAFVLGAVFAFLIEATGSIFAPMIVHFVFNSTSVVLSSVLVYLNDYLEKSGVYDDSMTAAAVTDSTAYMAAFIIYVPLAIGGAILCWLIFKYLAKRAGRTEHIKQMWKYRTGQSCFSIPLVIGLVLSVTYMILSEIVS